MRVRKIYKTQIPESSWKTGHTKLGVLTYGELTEKGVKQMIEAVGRPIMKDDVFLDIGSGAGKVVLHVAESTSVSKSIGVEMLKERYEVSEKLRDVLYKTLDGEYVNDRVEFINAKVSLTNAIERATIIYTCNQGFSSKVMKDIVKRIKPGTIFIYALPNKKLRHKKIKLATTWCRKAQFYRAVL